ncbi:MAG: Spy/CpxP family protein refolding chaperone [Candidatus Omnitrophica bacterium]|nr:Spy/CpxP family protein refolding chaperone [Candidatus Omnitrophota bacterium]MDD5487863.1 Spy/CpxP family protein refolding chaperone [Candidatus Omnitrophota bacterium]
MRKKGINVLALVICGTLMFTLVGPGSAMAYGKKGMDSKIYHKASYMVDNRDELGLTDEQVRQINAIKTAVKKEMIKKNAEIDLVAVDIKTMLQENKVDVKAARDLLDKKYELKKEKAKYLVGEYAALKDMLTDEQMGSLEKMWRDKGKGPCDRK